MCGLFGVINYGKNKIDMDDLIKNLAIASSVRGTDATGLSYMEDGKLVVKKEGKSSLDFEYDLPDSAKVVMGHTRMTTQGSELKNYNNHPFTGFVNGERFTLAHNGVLSNDTALKASFNITPNKIETDSYVAVQLIENFGKFNFEALKRVGENVQGTYSFTLMDSKSNWYLIKNNSPLSILHIPELKLYLYASTDSILFSAIMDSSISNIVVNAFKNGRTSTQLLTPKAGEIWRIDVKGKIKKVGFKPTIEKYVSSWGHELNWYNGGKIYEYSNGYNYTVLIDDSKNREDSGFYKEALLREFVNYGYKEEHFHKLIKFGYTLLDIEDALVYAYIDDLIDEVLEYEYWDELDMKGAKA